MTNLTRCAAIAATTLAVITPIAAAGTAQASISRHWTTIETLSGGKQQACKVSTNLGKTWTVYNRLDAHLARSVTGPLEATMRVTYRGKPTTRVWDSHYIQPGHYSTVGTVVLPRTSGYALTMALHASDFGTGGVPKIINIGLC